MKLDAGYGVPPEGRFGVAPVDLSNFVQTWHNDVNTWAALAMELSQPLDDHGVLVWDHLDEDA